MATGWAGDGAVQQQIDDSIEDAIKRARAQLPSGPSLSHWHRGTARPEAVTPVRVTGVAESLPG